jgi:hypothetical protein
LAAESQSIKVTECPGPNEKTPYLGLTASGGSSEATRSTQLFLRAVTNEPSEYFPPFGQKPGIMTAAREAKLEVHRNEAAGRELSRLGRRLTFTAKVC